MNLTEADINEILVNQISKLALIGSPGANFAAKRLPTESYQEASTFDLSYDEVLLNLQRYFSGVAPEIRTIKEGKFLIFSKVVGSGSMNMNPTVVIAVVRANDSTVYFAAYAKEGWIKQHSAEKAVKAFVASIG